MRAVKFSLEELVPFCANCGAAVDGRFCQKCGTPLEAGVPTASSAPPASGAAVDLGIGTNVASALCYLLGFITGIIFLVLAPYNQNKAVRFHAFQSIFLNLALIAFSIALAIVAIMMHAISFWLGSLVSMVHLLINLAFFGLWLFMMWKAYNNERVELPIIGPLAAKQA